MNSAPSSPPTPSSVPFRRDDEAPFAVAAWGWRFHHLGIPHHEPRDGETHIPHLKIFVSGFETSPYGVQWMRFEPDCPYPEIIRTVPHVAFEVDDLDAALEGKEILLAPSVPSSGVRAAMILHDGAPVELLEFRRAGGDRQLSG